MLSIYLSYTTYQVQATNSSQTPMPFLASMNPFSPSTNATILSECRPDSAITGDRNFTICFFKAANEIDLRKVDDIFLIHNQVMKRVVQIEITDT